MVSTRGVVGAVIVLAVVLGVLLRVPPPLDVAAEPVRLEDRQTAPVVVGAVASPADAEVLVSSAGGHAEGGAATLAREDCARAYALLVDDLVQALRDLETSGGDQFHRRAADVLAQHVAAAQGLDGCAGQGWSEALAHAADFMVSTDVASGCLLALLGAAGAEDDVEIRRPSRGEVWRGAVLGLGWALGAPTDEPQGLTIDVSAYLEQRIIEGPWTLPLVLSRFPGPALRMRLEAGLVVVAQDWDELLDREVALLALGTAVDDDPALMDVYASLLESQAEHARQVVEPVLFVLRQSKSPVARQAVGDFARRPMHPRDPLRFAQARLRMWLSQQADWPIDIELHLAPLRDDGGDRVEQVAALGSLVGLVDRLTDEQAGQVERELALALEGRHVGVVHTAAVAALSSWPGGAVRLAALDRVLRTSSSATQRVVAVRGLAATEGAYRGEALALLRRHRPVETADTVRVALDEALDQQP